MDPPRDVSRYYGITKLAAGPFVQRSPPLPADPALHACPVSKRLTLPPVTVKAQRVRISPHVSLR
jgi:hypothetical protein